MARLTLALVCCLAALAAAQPMLNQGDEISDSVIVKMASDTFSVQSSDGAAAADAAGDLGQPIGRNLRRVKVQAGERAQDVADRLAAMPGVEYASPDHPVWAEAVKPDIGITPQAVLPSNKGWKLQWGFHRIGMPSAWTIAKGADTKKSAVTLCLVDSGIDYKHPDLVANLAEGLGYNAVDGEDKTDPKDSAGHGTMCAGVISGFGAKGGVVGINWKNINLLSCKFMSGDGWGKTSDAIQCLDYCVQQGAQIISASWTSGQLDNPPLEEAVGRVEASGALLVVSAGNQGVDMKLQKNKYYPQAYAREYKNMLVVAASDEYDDHLPFSNYDPRSVHISAPGNWIYTTIMGGGYTFASGTSIAAPLVSGSAALVLAAAQDRLNKTMTAVELKALLMDSAEVLPSLKGRTASGARLRTDWALQTLLGKELSEPTKCLVRPGSNKAKCRRQNAAAKAAGKAAKAGKRRSMMMGLDGVAPTELPAQEAAAHDAADASPQQQQQQQQAAGSEAAQQQQRRQRAHLGRPSRRLMGL